MLIHERKTCRTWRRKSLNSNFLNKIILIKWNRIPETNRTSSLSWRMNAICLSAICLRALINALLCTGAESALKRLNTSARTFSHPHTHTLCFFPRVYVIPCISCSFQCKYSYYYCKYDMFKLNPELSKSQMTKRSGSAVNAS